ncbi:MAG: hypothetical protein K8823_1247 [Cenarchaeum symbiont of Oopsacas minuta]|nr:hypothetical protein [Cenarchaeum symbiont of Oopsacas minuta]
MSRYFTIKQANDAIPHVKEMYDHIVKCKIEIMRLEQEISSSDGSLARYVPLKQNLNSAATKFYDAIEKLESMGVLIKSIDDGLLDFPAERYGNEIWLCWKSGEDGVKFWHEKDSGFGSRKPIEISDESLI